MFYVVRPLFPEEEINSVEVEFAESSKSKNVENDTNVKQAVPTNIFRLLDPKNVAGTSSKNIPKNPTSTRTVTIGKLELFNQFSVANRNLFSRG